MGLGLTRTLGFTLAMLETLLGPLSSLLANAVGRLAGQPHFKLIASLVTPDYESRPGGYLALGLKIANMGRETAYFDRVEVVYRDGATQGVLVLGIPYEAPVNSNRSVVAYLPAT